MRAVKLELVKSEETLPKMRTIDWKPALRVTWIIVSWVFWMLWEITKMTVVVVGVMIGISLLLIGFLTHFVGGPPRWSH